MIKSLIILALLLLLVAGAFLSRPSPQSLKPYLQQKTAAASTGGGGAGGLIQGLLSDAQVDAFMKSCTFKDRLLWVDVERDGQTVYTGAFAHWWQRGSSAGAPAAPAGHSSKG